MGSKYATQSASGYNSSPPADDGSQTASNLITWAAQKTKLADPVKTLADAINTALVTAFDYSVRQITASDNTVAGDHMKCVEIAPTVTTAVTVSLGDAATMTNNYRVFVKNSSNRNQTLTRVTGGDTIDGTAGTVTIPPGCGVLVQTNTTPNGYLVVARYSPSDGGVLSSVAGTNTVTASLTGLPGYGAGQTFQFIPAATNTGATTLNINSIGAKNVFLNGVACAGGELLINVPVLVQYDGTQFNIVGNSFSGQLKFPATQNASADVNTLDDYEEGTWTPSLGGTTTYANQVGKYTKIGRLVFLQCYLNITLIGTGSTVSISGVPFTSAADCRCAFAVSEWANSATSFVLVGAAIATNATTISIRNLTAAAISMGASPFFANGASIYISGSYEV